MFFFKKHEQPKPAGFSDGLPHSGENLPVSLLAHSQFIKRVNCSQCGAPKTLPSATAYLYCDYCGSLIDYDFRIANADTNAGLTNTVFHRIIASVQAPLTQARMRGDRDEYRRLYRHVFGLWLQECPLAASPRAKTDPVFREQLVAYFAECAVVKDLDPRQAPLEAQMQFYAGSLQRIPTPAGAWMVAGPFWEYAGIFKQQMELAYELFHQMGVDAMDPDKAPAGVAIKMEYSTFCQGWLPHLSPADGEKLLKMYGLSADYNEVKPLPVDHRNCGICGSVISTLSGARMVVCENCGYKIDVASQSVPCSKCGALLSFPISANHLVCPYCSNDIHRI